MSALLPPPEAFVLAGAVLAIFAMFPCMAWGAKISWDHGVIGDSDGWFIGGLVVGFAVWLAVATLLVGLPLWWAMP